MPGPVVLPVTRASYAETLANTYYAKGMPGFRVKARSGYLRRAYSEEQLRVLYRYLSDVRYLGNRRWNSAGRRGRQCGGGGCDGYPGAGLVHENADSRRVALAGDDERFVAWAREMYRELYAETGGVPVRDAANGGAYINYPDADLADPHWNTSGVPWYTLYYGDNYQRLRRIKAEWDPNTVFRHGLSLDRPA